MLLENHAAHQLLLENERSAADLINAYALREEGSGKDRGEDGPGLHGRIDKALALCRKGMMDLDLLMEDSGCASRTTHLRYIF